MEFQGEACEIQIQSSEDFFLDIRPVLWKKDFKESLEIDSVINEST